MEPILELALRLPPRSSRHLLRELHGQLKTAIIEGRLKPGLRLPPTRTLASGLGVSRNTAVAAYDLLLSEGYLVARRGDGTYVADVIPRLSGAAASRHSDSKRTASTSARDRCLNPFWWNRSRAPLLRPDSTARFDFATGLPDSSIFPFDIWRRLSARALRVLSSSPARYGDSEGRWTLREAIARHVSFARAVACEPDDIVVTSGAQQAFDLLARILVTPSRTVVAVENPGYPPTRAAFAAAGAKVVPVPVDEEGLIVQRLPAGASVICVTPSHQFPMGTAMSASRRAALLEFAQKHRSVILEDDYDAEFRFGGRPLDALQTLDRSESVFYIGTFSKSLFPAIRLGFVVTPRWARDVLVTAKRCADAHCALHTQDTLAAFIADGHLARHVRRMRQLYSRRRELLLKILECDFNRWLDPIPQSAGLHFTAYMKSPDALSESGERGSMDAVVDEALKHDVGVRSLRPFFAGKPTKAGLIFGYGAISEGAIEEGLKRLRKVWA